MSYCILNMDVNGGLKTLRRCNLLGIGEDCVEGSVKVHEGEQFGERRRGRVLEVGEDELRVCSDLHGISSQLSMSM